MSPAHELALHLETEGVGDFAAEVGWSLNVSREPVKPDTVVTLYDTGGFDPLQVEIDLRQPTIQVRVRSKNYAEAIAKHQEIYDLLALPTARDIGSHHYLGIWLQGDIAGIGLDDNNRQLVTANYRINRQSLGVLT